MSAFVTCTAVATLGGELARVAPTAGSAEVAASTHADGQRSAIGAVFAVGAAALAGSPSVERSLGGTVAGTAAALVGARSDAKAVTEALPSALPLFSARRTVRGQLRGSAHALAQAAGEVYVLAVASPSRGEARVLGTTGHFASGTASGAATVTGEAQVAIPATVAAACTSAIGGAARGDLLAAASVWGSAACELDPFILRGGVKLSDGNTHCRPQAVLEGSPYVYGVQLAVGRATLEGGAQAQRTSGCSATARGQAVASAQIVIPFTGVVQVGAVAECRASLRAAVNGVTHPGSAATWASARALRAAAAFLEPSTAGGAITGGGAHLSVPLSPALDGADPSARCERTLVSAGAASASASASAANQINDLSRAPLWRTTAVGVAPAPIVVPGQDRLITQLGVNRSMAA